MRLLDHFQGLQWKLTLSYTLVTSATVILVMLTPLILSAGGADASEQLPRLIGLEVAQTAGQFAPFLDRAPVDQDGVRLLFHRAGPEFDRLLMPAGSGASITSVVTRTKILLADNPGAIEPPPPPVRPGFAAVVDKDGRLIATSWTAPAGEPFPSHEYPVAAQLLSFALRGETDPVRLTYQPAVGPMFVAAPVLGQGHEVLGAYIRTFPTPATPGPYLLEMAKVILPLSLAILLGTGLVGTAFGFFTARGLTRRLRALTETASAWSQGNFAVAAADLSTDELGQLARHLNRMADDLQHLVRAREELAAVEERNRLARDVHDSVKQQVFAISMNLGAAQALWDGGAVSARRHLDDAAALARQTQQELTAIIQTLRAVPLEEKGLGQALWEHFRQWERQSGVRLTDRVDVGQSPLPQPVEQAVFRLCQEALANIARHSGATTAEIVIRVRASNLEISITDNGRGFVATDDHPGLGLASMRQRVESLGGRFTVDSDSSGTRLLAAIHLTEDNPA